VTRGLRRARAEAVQPLWAHAGPSGPARQQAAGVWASRSLRVLGAQHPELWGGPRAGANRAVLEGHAKCSRMACTPPGAVRYASTRRRPPHREQAKTSSAFRPAQQPGPIHSRRPLLLRFHLRRRLRRWARLLWLRPCPRPRVGEPESGTASSTTGLSSGPEPPASAATALAPLRGDAPPAAPAPPLHAALAAPGVL
jgi:hypothetical protein